MHAYLYMCLMCSYKMLYIVGLYIPFWEVEFGGDVWGWVSSRESTVAYAAMDVGTKVYIEIQLYIGSHVFVWILHLNVQLQNVLSSLHLLGKLTLEVMSGYGEVEWVPANSL